MTKSHSILISPLFLSILGIAFCIWSGLGNDVNICVTAGCTLYHDFGIAGISLWWIGGAAFVCLAICALVGLPVLGKRLAALFLLGDIGFLALLAFTAPCVSCLTVGLVFAVTFQCFRKQAAQPARVGEMPLPRRSVLLWVWIAFFVVNLGLVARSQADIWPILDESGDARTRLFFSPECPYCKTGVEALSGNVETAFYPIAENDSDVYRIARMRVLLEDGLSMAEALEKSADFQAPSGLRGYSPELLLLRFRLLRNKAHIFAAGSQKVPFLEEKGLPPGLTARVEAKRQASSPASASAGSGSYEMPAELSNSGQCGGAEPCPPASADED